MLTYGAAQAYAVMNAGGAVEKMREQVNSLSFTAALLLLYCCFTAALLLLYYDVLLLY